MGTRALITIDKKPFIATHWDGDPSCLGADLLSIDLSDNKYKDEIISWAAVHTIDAADLKDKSFKKIIDGRFKAIAKKTKGKYTVSDLKELQKKDMIITFGIQSAEDYPIGDIKNYGDFAEYQYDLTDGKWTYRALRGGYPESLEDAEDFSTLEIKNPTS